MKEKFPLRYIQKYILKIQLGILGVLSLLIFYSLYESKSIEIISNQLLMREPASISLSESLLSTGTVSVDCQANQLIQAGAHQVRIESLFCEKNFQSVQAINKTTGSDITVFKRSPASFTTDYISLDKGENLISFSYKDSNKEIIKEFTIFRD